MLKEILEESMPRLGRFIIKKAIEEIKAQGHIIDINTAGFSETGEDSFEWQIEQFNDGLRLNIIANSYFLEMDTGTRAADINWRPEDMIEYGKAIYPGATEESILRRLTGLRNLQKVVGSPTRGAFNHTENGRRNNWIKYGIEDNEDEFIGILGLFPLIDQSIRNLVQRTVAA